MGARSRRRDVLGWIAGLLFQGGVALGQGERSIPPSSEAEADEWPRSLRGENVTFIVHPPQIDSWDEIRLKAYAAVSAVRDGEENASYGLIRFSAHTAVDRNERVVALGDYRLDDVVFPSSNRLANSFRAGLKKTEQKLLGSISLDRFEAALSVMDLYAKVQTVPIKNDPPEIRIESVPTMLVYVDGEPRMTSIPHSGLKRVLNTRVLMVQGGDGSFYLRLFDGWMKSNEVASDKWTHEVSPPTAVVAVLDWAKTEPSIDLLIGQEDPDSGATPRLEPGRIPKVISATSPTELIVTEGEWEFEEVVGTQLQYVSNTTGHIFRHTGEGHLYVLISGRWFRAASSLGPWTFVKGGNLPVDFRNIPDESPKENVRASVPDTPQAEESVIANLVPQTADVRRKEAKMTDPLFDGEPQLASIEGTALSYVANSPTPIVEVAGGFFAVENGAWFKSKSVRGPWSLADSVPPEIYGIPPSSPLHYVTYVRIYRVTRDAVTVGYTPGYFGTATTTGSGAVVVFGTGYHYYPWMGAYWFGPPVTYGYGMSITYTPWTGWTYGCGFGWSWGWGTVTVGWGWGCTPWWGPIGWGWYYPPAYRGGVAWGPGGSMAAWGPWGGWAATTGNVYSRWGDRAVVRRASGGYNPWTGNRWSSRAGMSYNSRTGTLAAGQRAAVGNVYTGNYAYGGRGAVTNSRLGVSASGGRVTAGNVATGNQASAGRVTVENDRTGRSTTVGGLRTDQGSAVRVGDSVFAGKDGSIYRHDGGEWRRIDVPSRPDSPRDIDRSRIQELDRQRSARTLGQDRSEAFKAAPRPTLNGPGRRGPRR